MLIHMNHSQLDNQTLENYIAELEYEYAPLEINGIEELKLKKTETEIKHRKDILDQIQIETHDSVIVRDDINFDADEIDYNSLSGLMLSNILIGFLVGKKLKSKFVEHHLFHTRFLKSFDLIVDINCLKHH